MAPHHALAHMLLGVVQMQTSRATQGIAECERALALDRNLAHAHGWIGFAKFLIGRSSETEAHINEARFAFPLAIPTFTGGYFLSASPNCN
jgi:hypothetical protein